MCPYFSTTNHAEFIDSPTLYAAKSFLARETKCADKSYGLYHVLKPVMRFAMYGEHDVL